MYYFFFISAQNHRLWVLVGTGYRGGSNKYPQPMFLSRNMKFTRICHLKVFIFWVVNLNFSIYLNRRVFVMGYVFRRRGNQKIWLIRGLDTCVRLSVICYQGNNFVTSCLTSDTKKTTRLKIGSTLKGDNLLPK